jgi:UDPglucose 6-dehydrogenase
VLVTDYTEIRELDPQSIASRVRGRYLVDARNAVDVDAWNAAGFDVHVLGRGRFLAKELAGTR